MKVQIGGFRDLEPWPAPGDTIDVPEHEAADLLAAGYAVAASENGEPDASTAAQQDADTAPNEDTTGDTKPVRRTGGRRKS